MASMAALGHDTGSSPRVRGTHRRATPNDAEQRFIPACAGNAMLPDPTHGDLPVHPRVCGERAGHARAGGAAERFIPACAGNATPTPSTTRRRTVHPRVCGERSTCTMLSPRKIGSSPRVRGTRPEAPPQWAQGRFIPACAGNAAAAFAGAVLLPVHPRVCGERGSFRVQSNPLNGSSPRVRGTPDPGDHRDAHRRFIPACAGNAKRRHDRPPSSPVHPRVCGERVHSVVINSVSYGSSPRVRGTRPSVVHLLAVGRFIPACAGNARTRRGPPGRTAVHPRVCGERINGLRRVQKQCGSSPRVRGTPLNALCGTSFLRFIPACAGNAHRRCPRRLRNPVHPRVCGEREQCLQVIFVLNGSSPRVRGTRHGLGAAARQRRFIPACAGNASCRGTGSSPTPVHPRVCGERGCPR